MTESDNQYIFNPNVLDITEGYDAIPTLDEHGRQLFVLPQDPIEVIEETTNRVKTTDVTDEPVIVFTQVPILDEENNQKSYEMERPVYEQIPILDENDEETGEFVNGPIIGYEGTGIFFPMWTMEEQQEVDDDDNPLYWIEQPDEIIRFESQPDLLITMDDESWTEDLQPAYELVRLPDPPSAPPPPSTEQHIEGVRSELQSSKLEQAQANTELFEMMLMLNGGML